MNNIPLTTFEGGIVLPYAQVNHSCVANVGFPWIAICRKVFMYAHRAIKKGSKLPSLTLTTLSGRCAETAERYIRRSCFDSLVGAHAAAMMKPLWLEATDGVKLLEITRIE